MINRMALELFGLGEKSRNGLLISDIRERFDEEENEHIRLMLDEVRNSNTEISFEETVNHDAETKLVLLARAKGAILSNNDRVIIISLTDITEQKKLEESLQSYYSRPNRALAARLRATTYGLRWVLPIAAGDL